jgi:hypothetical protein
MLAPPRAGEGQPEARGEVGSAAARYSIAGFPWWLGDQTREEREVHILRGSVGERGTFGEWDHLCQLRVGGGGADCRPLPSCRSPSIPPGSERVGDPGPNLDFPFSIFFHSISQNYCS